ncbi:hypothetical protein K435DRAFT_698014, partial [Dendrothele bispora CBS 962.96]
ISLENSGSVARDHLASERTWFTYVRTSLALTMSGVCLIRLVFDDFESQPSSSLDVIPFMSPGGMETRVKAIAVALVCFGIGVLCVGFIRYFTVQSSLIKGQFPVQSRFVVLGMAGLQLVLIGSVLGVVLMDF